MIDNKTVKELVAYFEGIAIERDLTGQEKLLLETLRGNKNTFVVSCLMREDLEDRGFDTTNVDDHTMERIADKMGDDFCESGVYWDSLVCWAIENKIPRLKDED